MQPSKIDPTHFEFIAELCEQHSDLIRVRFSSRHSTQKHYIATVQFDNYEQELIQGWYCTCSIGARVLGCCSHTAALLWYLGVRRAEYEVKEHPLSAQYLLEMVNDCIQYRELMESDDEEDDEARYDLASDHNDNSSDD